MLFLMMYFTIGLMVPYYKEIAAQRVVNDQKEKSRDLALERQREVSQYVSDVASRDTEQEFVMDYVPNDQREEILLSDIAQLAENTGISLFSVGFSEGRDDMRSGTASDSRVNLIEGKMIASGSYENFKRFMNELFHMKRLYSFKTFDLTKADQEETDEAGAPPQEQMLSGVISFAYGFIPGTARVDAANFDASTDFTLIDTIMNASAQTAPLVSTSANRANPFLP
jgi:hypothetical protein